MQARPLLSSGATTMFPDPGRQAQQRFDESRRFRDMNQQMDAQRRRRARGGSGAGGFLTFLILVAVIVYVAHDPELRTTVTTFARNVLAHVQSD
ncbi:hypothetical protein [Streptomyces sp. NPDC058475]|uniref:hypothetical protein n=2 Tax=unclassified Streptomyces TaxID=2593676 RepID=UPI003653CB29